MRKSTDDDDPPSPRLPELTGSWDPRGPFMFSAKGLSAVLVVALIIVLTAALTAWAVG